MNEKPKRGLGGNGGRSTWAYILIGVGVIFLIVNLLNINLLRLWPLVLVIIGLMLLFGRTGSGTARTSYFSAPRAGVGEADIDVHLSVGRAQVRPLAADSDLLLDAEVTYVGEIDFRADGGRVVLKQTGDSGLHWINPANWVQNWDDGMPWRVGLARGVPMRLVLHGGAGKADADLRALQVTDLRLHGGLGEMSVALPDPGAGYSADVDGGMGELSISLPSNTSLTLRIKGGVGQVNLETPVGAGVQIRARSGIGDVKVPSRFQRVAGSSGGDFEIGKSGTWETPGFANAPVQICVDYEGGVGELRVR